MACFRLVTLRPLRPLFSVPRFLRRIADATVLCDFLLYRRVPLRVLLAMGASLLGSGAVAAGNRAASMPARADARRPQGRRSRVRSGIRRAVLALVEVQPVVERLQADAERGCGFPSIAIVGQRGEDHLTVEVVE